MIRQGITFIGRTAVQIDGCLLRDGVSLLRLHPYGIAIGHALFKSRDSLIFRYLAVERLLAGDTLAVAAAPLLKINLIFVLIATVYLRCECRRQPHFHTYADVHQIDGVHDLLFIRIIAIRFRIVYQSERVIPIYRRIDRWRPAITITFLR